MESVQFGSDTIVQVAGVTFFKQHLLCKNSIPRRVLNINLSYLILLHKPGQVALVGAGKVYSNFLKLGHLQVHVEVTGCRDSELLHEIVAEDL